MNKYLFVERSVFNLQADFENWVHKTLYQYGSNYELFQIIPPAFLYNGGLVLKLKEKE